MNDCDSSDRKYKCIKEVQNIEVITSIYDPKCLTNLLKNRSKHQNSISGSNICKPPQSILGNNMCKYFFSINEQEKVDKSKYELKLEK